MLHAPLCFYVCQGDISYFYRVRRHLSCFGRFVFLYMGISTEKMLPLNHYIFVFAVFFFHILIFISVFT